MNKKIDIISIICEKGCELNNNDLILKGDLKDKSHHRELFSTKNKWANKNIDDKHNLILWDDTTSTIGTNKNRNW